MRTFEASGTKRFWNIEVKGRTVTVTYGKVGGAGQTRTKRLPSPDAAKAAADDMIMEKRRKGYTETTPTAPATVTEAEAFEASLCANPDDLAGWCAYADWLAEQGDPRGEFMQTQIALEDESRTKDERDQLKAREAELLAEHEREWLGELAPHCLDHDEYRNVRYSWRRGFVDYIQSDLTMSCAQALATAPAARFLRELHLFGMGEVQNDDPPPRVPTPSGNREHALLFELIGAPCLQNLRVFRFGHEEPPEDGWTECYTSGWDFHHLFRGMSRIEEIHLLCQGQYLADLFALKNMTHLRVLRAYHVGGRGWDRQYEYPLDVLAANPAFANLTHLQFHPHCPEGLGDDGLYHSYLPLDQIRALLRSKHLKKLTHLQLRLSDMGDEGIREFVTSGALKRLVWLDLRHGRITDEGARELAACADAKRLERLDLSRNAVTAAGLAALRAAGVNAVANNPLTQQELNDEQYLREGAFE